MSKAIIQIRNLNKQYEQGGKRRTILEDVDLDIQEGEFFVILGKSGSGKAPYSTSSAP